MLDQLKSDVLSYMTGRADWETEGYARAIYYAYHMASPA